jgi:hypothetical protein
MAELSLLCNQCLHFMEPKTQAIATSCHHLFCELLMKQLRATLPAGRWSRSADEAGATLATAGLECAKAIVEGGAGCPQCEHSITKRCAAWRPLLDRHPGPMPKAANQSPRPCCLLACHCSNIKLVNVIQDPGPLKVRAGQSFQRSLRSGSGCMLSGSVRCARSRTGWPGDPGPLRHADLQSPLP